MDRTKFYAENAEFFECNNCDFICSKKSDYDRHVLTAKHKNRTKLNILEQKNAKKTRHYLCKHCGKEYAARNSLWYHEQKCQNAITNEIANFTDKDIIMKLINNNMELLKENNEFKKMMLEQQTMFFENSNKALDVCKHGMNNTVNNVNNSHNKTFNLQLFLNETCKNAMNITDFVNSIQYQLSDLEKFDELGYVEGISNIIATNLKAMDVSLRPVHCTDRKRETIYVRDDNKWIKDDDNKSKMRLAIKSVANRNTRLLPQYRAKYPDCINSTSRLSDKYDKMVLEAMGGIGDTAPKEDKIIRNISKIITIDKKCLDETT